MTLPTLVSFSGYPGAGKDAAADLLVSRVRFVKCTMTDPLEKTLLHINPWIVDHKENTIERFADLHSNLGFDQARDFEEARRLIQATRSFGQNTFGLNVWNNQVFEEVQALRAMHKSVAVSGVDTKDQLELVRTYDGVSVWIQRSVKIPKHGYPISAKDCDIVVVNDGTLMDLYVNVMTALEEHNTEEMNSNVG